MDEDSIFLGKEHLQERIEGALRALGGPLTKVLEAEGAKRTPSIALLHIMTAPSSARQGIVGQ